MSIVSIISFVVYAMLLMLSIGLISCQKNKKPLNKVHYYVTRGNNYSNHMVLWLGKPEWDKITASWNARSKYVHFVCNDYYFDNYKLNPSDFSDMEYDEIREVFLNFEDENESDCRRFKLEHNIGNAKF